METQSLQVIPLSQGMVQAFLIKGEKNILVDTGLPGKLENILGELNKHQVKPQDIQLIVITHNHTDHVGELYRLKELTGAKVAIHSCEADDLKQGKTAEVNPTGLFGRLITKFMKNPSFQGVEADILIDKELSLVPFGIDGKVMHTPGHTPGSVSIILSNGEVIVGDLFSAKGAGEGAKANKPVFATNLKELKEALKGIAEISPKIIYNSHGTPCHTEALKTLIEKL